MSFLKTHLQCFKDWKNATILLLSLAVLVLGGVLASEKLTGLVSGKPEKPSGEPVAALDVMLDREQLRFVDILFDRPLGEGRIGEVLGQEPASISPPTRGFWRWEGTSLLRFHPSGRLKLATEYSIELHPQVILLPGQVLTGSSQFKVITDQFRVERVDIQEEPADADFSKVILRGQARFNYSVKPENVVRHFKLFDPAQGENPLPVTLETSYQSRVIGFRTPPLPKQKSERQVRLVVDSGLSPADGNVSLTSDFVKIILIGSNEKLTVRGIEPTPGLKESSIGIRLSSPVQAEVAKKFLSVSPSLQFQVTAGQNSVSLTGPFKAGESYQLQLQKGLPARDDSSLQSTFTTTVHIPDLQPSVDFQSPGQFLLASGNRNVAVDAINVGRAHLTVDRVFPNNLFILFQYYRYLYNQGSYWNSRLAHALGDRVTEKELDFPQERNQKVSRTLDLNPLIPKNQPGIYRLGLTQEGSSRGEQRWVLMTDLGIVAKRGKSEFLVWVTSFKDLHPVAGAQVRLISDQNQEISEGTTGQDGFWKLEEAGAALKNQNPFLVVVQRGRDFSFLLLSQHGISTTGLDVGGSITPSSGYQAYLYGERDLYRPGETVKGVCLVRDRNLKAPPEMPLLLRHRDPQGRERGVQKLSLQADGSAEFSLEVPEYARTGGHTLELLAGDNVIGRYSFQVEEFVPDRIKVEVKPDRDQFKAGESIQFQVSSSYLFGPPASNLAVESRVRLIPTIFSAKDFPGYSFSNNQRKFKARDILNERGRLDEKGAQRFKVTLPAQFEVPSSLRAEITARVQEQGGRGVTALSRVSVHPYPYYLGLRREGTTYAEPGKPVVFQYVAVSPEGKAITAGGLRAEFFQIRWHTLLRRTPSGTYRYESTPESILLDSHSIPAGTTRGTFQFTAQDYGSYRVVLTAPDSGASSEMEFYASGWGFSPWAIKNPGKIEIDLDRAEYEPGQRAVAQIRTPFPGKVWLTVERDQVLYSRVINLSGNTAKVEIPVEAQYRPNAYLTATLIRSARDLQPGTPGRAFGAVPLVTGKKEKRLRPEITAPEQIRPKSTLEVQVRTEPGTRVTVAAVDEGILQLIAQQTADPFAYFYRKMALGVRSFDTYALLLPEVKPAQGRSQAGGGESVRRLKQMVRTEGIRRIKPVAFFSGIVKTDSRGRATVHFNLPQFQGALRLMAVAFNGDRFGSADHLTRVRDPLVLLPTFPRFLSFQERLRLPVSLHNGTGRAGSFQVRLEAAGPAALEGDSEQTLQLPDSAEKTVYFDLKTSDSPGDVSLKLKASGNSETTEASRTLSLRPDLPPRTQEQTGGVSETETTLAPVDPRAYRKGTVERELRIGPVPLLQFSGQLRNLLQYPYGCLEQTVSRVFPWIYFGDLARELDPKLFGRQEPLAHIQEGLRRIAGMQLYNGGFAMWPSSDTLYPWGSVYACHFLVEAQKAGIISNTFLYNRALQFLSNEVKAKSTYSADELERTVYALYVLARAGHADLGTMDFIREHRMKQLRPLWRGLLGAAYAAIGNRQALEEMLNNLQDIDRVGRQTGQNLNSALRNRALLLLAFMDAAPGDSRIPGLVDRLSREARATPWWNTQETSFVFLALGRFFHQQAQQPPYSGKVLAGDRVIGTFKNETQIFRDLPLEVPIRIQMDAGFRAGSAFYSLDTRGVPSDAAFQPQQQGIEISRDLLSEKGSPLDLQSVQQGDLIVFRIRVRSVSGPLQNVAIENLLPTGLEVENPRLKTTQTLPWIGNPNMNPAALDIRDDRVLFFTDLPANRWQTVYGLLRAVVPGSFRLPPVHAEAMYNPALRATGSGGRIQVVERQ